MRLHEAIDRVLVDERRAMSLRELADEINRRLRRQRRDRVARVPVFASVEH